MIPRILVPKNARLVVAPSDDPPRRLSSELDVRTLVPLNLPHVELDPRTSIPAYFTLDVLGSRTVVPRDMPNTPLDATTNTPGYVPLTILDSRVLAKAYGRLFLESLPKRDFQRITRENRAERFKPFV